MGVASATMPLGEGCLARFGFLFVLMVFNVTPRQPHEGTIGCGESWKTSDLIQVEMPAGAFAEPIRPSLEEEKSNASNAIGTLQFLPSQHSKSTCDTL